jgi:hypothetical protein
MKIAHRPDACLQPKEMRYFQNEETDRIVKNMAGVNTRANALQFLKNREAFTSFCLFRVEPFRDFSHGVDFFDAFCAFHGLFHGHEA